MLRSATPGDPLRLGVLVSGTGSNLQVLLDTFNAGPREARVVAVASTRPGVRALERAAEAGVPHEVFVRSDDRDTRLAAWLDQHRVELVVCAGWMGILTPAFLERHVAINLHPGNAYDNASQFVRQVGRQRTRRLRRAVRLPPSPSSALIHFDEPCVVTTSSRRMFCNRGRRRLLPFGRCHATPLTHTRSIQPLSIAGCPAHHVG